MKKASILLFVTLFVVTLFATGCRTEEERQQVNETLYQQKQEILLRQEKQEEKRILQVAGCGEINVAPDQATILLNVSEQAATVEEAEAVIKETLSSIRFFVAQMGVKRSDMIVGQATVYPIQDQNKIPAEVTGYIAANTVTIIVRDVAQTGNIIGAAIEAGAAGVQNATFELVDETAVYREALTKAMIDATQKAELIAQAAGETLGKPILVKENSTSFDAASSAIAENISDDMSQFSLDSINLRVTAQVVVEYQIG